MFGFSLLMPEDHTTRDKDGASSFLSRREDGGLPRRPPGPRHRRRLLLLPPSSSSSSLHTEDVCGFDDDAQICKPAAREQDNLVGLAIAEDAPDGLHAAVSEAVRHARDTAATDVIPSAAQVPDDVGEDVSSSNNFGASASGSSTTQAETSENKESSTVHRRRGRRGGVNARDEEPNACIQRVAQDSGLSYEDLIAKANNKMGHDVASSIADLNHLADLANCKAENLPVAQDSGLSYEDLITKANDKMGHISSITDLNRLADETNCNVENGQIQWTGLKSRDE
ncbi:hypothetical protein PG994_009569 [Apiospora phragmitis]|uniref:Uncharacterized protein n=1 Tax=Apiospora phragmitis TaxID=2905665 RepID=A0ABR1U715_9PEZI